MRAWVIALVLLFASTAHADDAKPEPGYLVVYSKPFAKIFVDGKDTKKTTPITTRGRLTLAPGKHTLTFVVRTAGLEDRFNFTITIESGKTTKVTKDLSR